MLLACTTQDMPRLCACQAGSEHRPPGPRHRHIALLLRAGGRRCPECSTARRQGDRTAHSSPVPHPPTPAPPHTHAGGVKGTLAYIPAANDALATLQVDKRVNDSDLTLKAAYQLRGDVFTVEVRLAGRRNCPLGERRLAVCSLLPRSLVRMAWPLEGRRGAPNPAGAAPMVLSAWSANSLGSTPGRACRRPGSLTRRTSWWASESLLPHKAVRGGRGPAALAARHVRRRCSAVHAASPQGCARLVPLFTRLTASRRPPAHAPPRLSLAGTTLPRRSWCSATSTPAAA